MMKTTTHRLIAVYMSVVLMLSLGLLGCSSDDPVSPETTTAPMSFSETETFQSIALIDGGRELLEEIPDANKRNFPSDARLFLTYETNTIEPGNEPVEPPLNSSYFRYQGFGIPLGRNTGEGPSIENFATLVQVGSTTFTDWRGDQLSCDFEGTFAFDQATGNVQFSGDLVFTGGTGRYNGATGAGGYVGRANVFEAAGQNVWYGYLVLDD
jgi:hypothetical protein